MDIAALRADLPLLNECLYFNTGGIAPSPRIVTESLINDFTDISRHGPPLIMDPATNSARLVETRTRFAELLGVETNDLCLTRGVSDGVNIVYNGFAWEAGDELIITDEEHPAVQVPSDRLAEAYGVKLVRLTLSDDAEAMLRHFRSLITPRTRLVTLSHVSTDTGTRLPAKAICEIAHEHDLPVLYDGAQSLGQFPVNVPDIGADFYSLLGYKWLFGPYSAGALYIAKPWQGRLSLSTVGARTERRVDRPGDYYLPPEGAKRFEFGALTPPVYYATATAVDYVRGIGIPEIETRVRRLADSLRAELTRIPGLTLESPSSPDTATGIVAFQIKGIDGRDLNAALRSRNIITRPTFLKFSGVRVSVAFFTTEAELDAVVQAAGEIAHAS